MTTRRKMHVWALVVYFQYIFLEYATGNSPQFAWQGESANITCSAKATRVHWYKEKTDGGLLGINTNICAVYQPPLKYCAEKNILTINKLDENDTGIYYCSDEGLSQTFENGSILLIRDAITLDDRHRVKPILSLLAQNQEERLGSHTIVLMCIVLHWSEGWSSVIWNISGNISEGQTVLNPDGVIRSLIFILKENASMDLNAQCTVQEKLSGETISAIMQRAERKRHDCLIVVYVGVGIIAVVLLIHQIILFYRRRTMTKKHAPPAGGTVQSLSENDMVVYAAVKH